MNDPTTPSGPVLRACTRPLFDRHDPAENAERFFVVEHGDNLLEFDCFGDARTALIAATAASTVGRDVWPCQWAVPRYHPEPDFPSDLVGECGAVAVVDDDGRGWSCTAGHSHRSDLEYFDDDDLAVARRDGVMLPSNAAHVDGTPNWSSR